jgi:hypothetical protein
MKRAVLLILAGTISLVAAFQQRIFAQDTTNVQGTMNVQDTTKRTYRNNIHFNITNRLIFGSKSIIFGYERVLNKRRSFTINVGQTGFPTLNIINSDSIKANTLRDEGGFHISGDYRFYLAKENKYDAPRGIYIGPYFSYNYFSKEHLWTITSTAGGTRDVESKTNMNISTLGIELGYQFVLWNRISLDMILAGPGVAAYRLQADLGTNLSEEDRSKFFEKLNEALTEKFPGYSVAVDEGEFKTKGSTNTTSLGYRYIIQLGFRF